MCVAASMPAFSPSNACAQTGQLELFADRAGISCALTDSPGFVSIFVIQTGGESSTGVGWFSAPKPACWNATWLTDNWAPNSLKWGTSQTQLLIAFGPCRPLPAFVAEILFMSAGSAPACCRYQITSTSNYTNCNFAELPMIVGPGSVTINPSTSCPCMGPVATESSTWGRVKSLYR